MYKLYYSPGACSLAPHVVLNEIGKPFEAIKIDLHKGDGRKPEFLKINPRGQVPVLDDDGTIIKEGAAILLHLCEKENSPLLPKSGPTRTEALEWMMWANASLHPAYGKMFWTKRNVKDEAQQKALLNTVFDQIQSYWDEAETRLGQTKYLAGDAMTCADILISVFANWGNKGAVKLGPNVMRVIREVSARPSFQKAIADEQADYKIAA